MERNLEELAEIKKTLSRKLEKLERQMEILRECIQLIDKKLVEKSFTTAEKLIITPTEKVVKAEEKEELGEEIATITFRKSTLAKIYKHKSTIRIIPSKNVKFKITTPPFKIFFINKVLEGMRRKDEQLVETGELMPDEMIQYEVKTKNDIIREIVIRNVKEDRVNSIKGAARWTFTRMYEKYLR